MADLQPFQDSALTPVPEARMVGSLKVALVQASLGVTLPVLTEGAEVALARGLPQALSLFCGCCLLVALLGLATSTIGARLRLSTYAILGITFGKLGARPVNLMTAVVLAGWFAATADYLGRLVQPAVVQTGLPLGQTATTLLLLTITAMIGMFGFRTVERVAAVIAPLSIALMLVIAARVLNHASLGFAWHRPGEGQLTLSASASSLVGLFVLAAVLAPDYARFTRTPRQAMASVLGMALGFPLVLTLAAVPAVVLGTSDYFAILRASHFDILGLGVVVVSTGVCNALNLYSSTLTLATIFTRVDTRLLGLGVAIAAAVAVLAGISTLFESFLLMLSVAATPLAGVYVATLLFPWRRSNRAPIDIGAFVSWTAGVFVGVIGLAKGHLFTPLPAIDSIFVSFAIRCIQCASFARFGAGRFARAKRTNSPQ